MELQQNDFSDSIEETPAIYTIGLQRDIEIIRPWIQNCHPFIVCGPEGCGKSLVIKSAFEVLKKTQKITIATIYCNA